MGEIYNLQEKGKNSSILNVIDLPGYISLIKTNRLDPATLSPTPHPNPQPDLECTLYTFRDGQLDTPYFSYKLPIGVLPVALDGLIMSGPAPTPHLLLGVKDTKDPQVSGRLTLQNVLVDQKKFRNVLYSKAELVGAQNYFRVRSLAAEAELVMNVGGKFVYSRFKKDDLGWASHLKDNHTMFEVCGSGPGWATVDFSFDQAADPGNSQICFLSQNGQWHSVSVFAVRSAALDLGGGVKLEKVFESELYSERGSFSCLMFTGYPGRVVLAGSTMNQEMSSAKLEIRSLEKLGSMA